MTGEIKFTEIIKNNQDILIFLYCIVLLWTNIGYLKEHKSIREGMKNISSEDEIEIDVNRFSLVIFRLIFQFFRSWLIYLIVFQLTENAMIILILGVSIIADLYHSFYNSSLENLSKSNLNLYRIVADTLFITAFVIYYFALS